MASAHLKTLYAYPTLLISSLLLTLIAFK